MRLRCRLDTLAAAAAAILALALFPRPAAADHSVGNSCYTCHKLGSTAVYKGTRAIWTGAAIGLTPPVTQPLTCDFCHTDYKQQFNATVASNHPVMHINGSVMDVHINGSTYSPASGYTGVKLMCAGCHGGNPISGTRNPDVAPLSYDQTGKDTTTDGYPDHELAAAANGQVVPFAPAWDTTPAAGDNPHATAAYNHKASTDPATDYALCFTCHDGSTATSHQVDVETAYTTAGGGHTFKSDGARIGCMDCHDSHGSASLRLYNRAGTPITSDPNGRLICLDCHAGASRNFTSTTAGTTRSVTVPSPPTNVAAHTGGTSACTLCHDPHNPSGGRSDCFDCHSTNTTQTYKDALGGGFTKYVDDGAGDDIGYSGTNHSEHTFTFANGNSAACADCHVVAAGSHGNGSTYDDLKYNGPNGKDWPVSTATETGNTFGSLVEFCLGCHRGGTNYWGLTPPAMNTFVDFGPDGTSGGGDNVTNNYGHGDVAVTGYNGNAPTIHDTATGAGHDPPSGYTGVPMFAHYTQGATSGGTKWWQLGSTSAPQALPCLDCHNAHGAPNASLYRSPRSTPTEGIAAGSRSICLDCHVSTVTVEGRTPLDPTTGPTGDRYGNPVSHHNATATQSCSSSATQCHNPHSPSCEVCHGYPP